MTTITREQFKAACHAADMHADSEREAMRAAFTAAGITIAEPEPPAAMLKLAADEVVKQAPLGDWGQWQRGFVAALQHAAKVVRGTDYHANLDEMRDSILRALGAIE